MLYQKLNLLAKSANTSNYTLRLLVYHFRIVVVFLNSELTVDARSQISDDASSIFLGYCINGFIPRFGDWAGTVVHYNFLKGVNLVCAS